MKFKIFINGLITGLFLQLAVGPVFFFIIDLSMQRTIFDGLIGALAVTIVDFLYIALSVLGIGKSLEKKKVRRIFGLISSIVLIIFGFLIIKEVIISGISTNVDIGSKSLLSSFISVFVLTISSPMTIIFFTSLFASKAVEYNYTKKELPLFGLGTGLATPLFMGASAVLFSLIGGNVPITLIKILNLIVGFILVAYGVIRAIKVLKQRGNKR